jgi:hypothetical protein
MLPAVGSSRRLIRRYQGGLAAARLAHQSDRLALADGEAHLVDGVQQPLVADLEALGEVADLEQRRHSGFQHSTSWRSPIT